MNIRFYNIYKNTYRTYPKLVSLTEIGKFSRLNLYTFKDDEMFDEYIEVQIGLGVIDNRGIEIFIGDLVIDDGRYDSDDQEPSTVEMIDGEITAKGFDYKGFHELLARNRIRVVGNSTGLFNGK